MEQHKTDECEEIPVECEFKVIGCTKVITDSFSEMH